MRNNILGGLVVFFVVVACLILLDDITSPTESSTQIETAEIDYNQSDKELAAIEVED